MVSDTNFCCAVRSSFSFPATAVVIAMIVSDEVDIDGSLFLNVSSLKRCAEITACGSG
jgi:hypothetical protein